MPTIKKRKLTYFENKKIDKKKMTKNIGASNLALIIGKSISQLIGMK
jgi:hypothetical protein